MTRRLYHDDAYALTFSARVQHTRLDGDVTRVVLDESAFYPESGGQMADHGTLGGVDVVDVQVVDDVVEHTLVTTALSFESGDLVDGVIEGRRRRLHRQLHTGQHILSQAAWRLFKAKTVSSRLGETGCNLDLDVDALTGGQVEDLLGTVHDVIDDDTAIRAYFPDDAELNRLDLRRSPKVDDGIRVVDIDGYDITPCGGTHCRSAGEVGLVHVFSTERVRKTLRLWFDAGSRARQRLRDSDLVLQKLKAPLNASGAAVVDAVAKLQDDLRQQTLATKIAHDKWLTLFGETFQHDPDLLQDGAGIVVVDDVPPKALSALAQHGLRLDGCDAFCAVSVNGDGSGHIVVVGPDGSDQRALFKAVADAHDGKGGGRPNAQQGRLATTTSVADSFRTAVRATRGL